jgi:hypothetical protein
MVHLILLGVIQVDHLVYLEVLVYQTIFTYIGGNLGIGNTTTILPQQIVEVTPVAHVKSRMVVFEVPTKESY